MNHLKRSLLVGVLMLTLTLSAFAGQMETTVTSPPPPAAGDTETNRTEAATGFMDTTGTEIALSLIQGMLSMF